MLEAHSGSNAFVSRHPGNIKKEKSLFKEVSRSSPCVPSPTPALAVPDSEASHSIQWWDEEPVPLICIIPNKFKQRRKQSFFQ